MIKLKRIKLNNFISYGQIDNQIDLSKYSIALINGLNGSGKSSIFEGISYALYGQTIKSIRYEDLIRTGTNKCYVELAFNSNNDVYNLVRIRDKKSIIELSKNGKNINFKNVTEADLFLKELLKINFGIFKLSNNYSLDSNNSFLELNDRDRKDIFTQLFSLDVFEELYNKGKEYLSKIENNIIVKNSKLDAYRDVVEPVNKSNSKEQEKYRKDFIKFSSDKLKYEKDIDDIKTNINNKQQEINLLKKRNIKVDCPICNNQIHLKCNKCGDITKKYENKTLKIIHRLDDELLTLKEEFSEVNHYYNDVCRGLENLEDNIVKDRGDSKNDSIVKTIKELNSELDGLGIKKEVLSFLMHDVFGNKGAKIVLINKIIQDFNYILNKVISSVTNGSMKVELYLKNDRIQINVTDQFGEIRGCETISSGEKNKLKAALIFALIKLLKQKNYCFDFLLMDEVFVNLDYLGKEFLMEYINKLNKEINQIFIISHDKLDLDLPKINIVKENGVSKIKE